MGKLSEYLTSARAYSHKDTGYTFCDPVQLNWEAGDLMQNYERVDINIEGGYFDKPPYQFNIKIYIGDFRSGGDYEYKCINLKSLLALIEYHCPNIYKREEG